MMNNVSEMISDKKCDNKIDNRNSGDEYVEENHETDNTTATGSIYIKRVMFNCYFWILIAYEIVLVLVSELTLEQYDFKIVQYESRQNLLSNRYLDGANITEGDGLSLIGIEFVLYIIGALLVKVLLIMYLSMPDSHQIDRNKVLVSTFTMRNVIFYNLFSATSERDEHGVIILTSNVTYVYIITAGFGSVLIVSFMLEALKSINDTEGLISWSNHNKTLILSMWMIVISLIVYIGKANITGRSLFTLFETRGPGLLFLTFCNFFLYLMVFLEWSLMYKLRSLVHRRDYCCKSRFRNSITTNSERVSQNLELTSVDR
jgi:hypothetical protein